MKAIERVFFSNDLITIILFFGFVLLFLMKLYKPQRLFGYTVAFFTQGYIEKRVEENVSFFSPFYILLFSFSLTIISLTVFIVLTPLLFERNLFVFLLTLAFVSLFYVVKKIITYCFIVLFEVKEELNYFIHTQNGYLYTVSLLLFPMLIFHQYFLNSITLLVYIVALLLIFRGFLILVNNKKVIFSHIFYFILYFCTLELAPLLILYKTIN